MNAEIRAARKAIRQKPMPKSLEKRFIQNGMSDMLSGIYSRTAELFAENSAASKALYIHLKQILPCIAFYEALQQKTGDKQAALELFDEWAFDELKKLAAMLRKAMKTGLYKKVPAIFDRMVDKVFGADAGFRSRAAGEKPFARDMLACPYYETCQKYGCPELTQFFCKSDDITYGNMHPKLIWKRTQTLGTGGSCCDFRLWVEEKGGR